MDRKELLSAFSRLKVQTGSLACLGCGYEHQCSTKGCAIIRKATEELARYEQAFSIMAIEETKQSEAAARQKLRAELEKQQEQLMRAKKCVAGLSMLLKAIDGKMVMDMVRPIAEKRLNQYWDRYPSVDVVMDETPEMLDNYYAKMAIKFIEQKKDALQNLDGWCESYQEEHDLEYTPAEMAAWKAGMQFGNDTAHEYLSDLIEGDPASMWEHEI